MWSSKFLWSQFRDITYFQTTSWIGLVFVSPLIYLCSFWYSKTRHKIEGQIKTVCRDTRLLELACDLPMQCSRSRKHSSLSSCPANIVRFQNMFPTWSFDIETLTADEVAEWLRRWTANPMCCARVGSNPILVVSIINIFSESSANAKRFAAILNILFALLFMWSKYEVMNSYLNYGSEGEERSSQ